MIKTVVQWGLVIFVIYYLATDPAGAAAFITHVLHGLRDAGHSGSELVSHVGGGR